MTLGIPKKGILNQSLLIAEKCYKVLLSKNIFKYFFKRSDEIKTKSEH